MRESISVAPDQEGRRRLAVLVVGVGDSEQELLLYGGAGEGGVEDVGEERGEVRPREKMGTTSWAGVHIALHTGQEGWVDSHWELVSDGSVCF